MNAESQPEARSGAHLVLFITGDSPRSQRARGNLEQALNQLAIDGVLAEVVDLLSQPEQVIKYGVFATPALMNASQSGNPQILYGDLSNTDRLLKFLATGLPGKKIG
ncbi:MAG: circadian clock KaiB family protein [Gammaproteobacteria bacterium]